MTIVNVDTSNPANFELRRPIPAGQYVFEIANDLVVTKAGSSDNKIIKVELRCRDEGEYKGSIVFDTITLTKKAEFKLCHLVLAAGTQTRTEMANGIELDLLKGCLIEADITVAPPREDPTTGRMYPEKNQVKRYIFDAEKA